MSLDIVRILAEIAAAPPAAPMHHDLVVAVVNDVFRRAGLRVAHSAEWTGPKLMSDWDTWGAALEQLQREQLAIVAHWLQATSLGPQTVAAVRESRVAPRLVVPRFLEAIRPLTIELIAANATRQQEVLRKWARACQTPIVGEEPDVSKRRLEQLDYGKTLVEFQRAEKARKDEAERKAAAIREAQEREAQNQYRE